MKKIIAFLSLFILVATGLQAQTPIGRVRAKDVQKSDGTGITDTTELLAFTTAKSELRKFSLKQLGIAHYSRPATTGAATTHKPKIYTRELTVAGGGGLVVDTLTLEGTATGTAIFTTIYSVNFTVTSNDTIGGIAYVKSIGGSNKTITVRAEVPNTTLPKAQGTKVYMTIMGE